jgi:predicted glycosyltransferase
LLRSIQCPVLVIYGAQDTCQPYGRAKRLAELTGGDLVVARGSGHMLQGRSPVTVNHWIRDFATKVCGGTTSVRTQWTRPLNRPRRALYLCSPIGLGHARRDIAIAAELRRLRPDLQIDWLTQHPVSALLERYGERVHPASTWLANESAHFESEAGEHDLHAFQALRSMDEILVNNFMVFDDLVREESYDLWIGDEAWDLDYFLHENPELKRAAYVWLTDFVGVLPTPEGGDAEAALTADYNAEMLEQIARFPRVRDRSLFIGDADDVVPDDFGPGLGPIRDWTEKVFDFTGYVTGYPPSDVDDRDELRAEFGFGPDDRICVVSVGGSGVGGHLLRRVMAAYPATARAVPGLRMVAVTGPRIDPGSLSAPAGVEVRGFVPDLHRLLAACDVAVVQGGLTTTMELAATGRPFIYVPLRRHFEQNQHVRHRLAGHRAGRRLADEELNPETRRAP